MLIKIKKQIHFIDVASSSLNKIIYDWLCIHMFIVKILTLDWLH